MSGSIMPSLDTNCLLRLLLGDIPEQAASVTALINSGESVVVADVALILTFDTKLANQLSGAKLLSP